MCERAQKTSLREHVSTELSPYSHPHALEWPKIT